MIGVRRGWTFPLLAAAAVVALAVAVLVATRLNLAGGAGPASTAENDGTGVAGPPSATTFRPTGTTFRPTGSSRSTATSGSPGTSGPSSPRSWCPSQGEAPPTSCIGYDGESAIAVNHRYSKRADVPPDRITMLVADQRNVEVVIRQALHSTPVMHPQQVREVLAAHGYQVSFSLRDSSELTSLTTFEFAVEKGGCIPGTVSPGQVTMGEVGGYIADGGCLPAFGH